MPEEISRPVRSVPFLRGRERQFLPAIFPGFSPGWVSLGTSQFRFRFPFSRVRNPLPLSLFARPGSTIASLLRASRIHFRFSVSPVTVLRSILHFTHRGSAFASPFRASWIHFRFPASRVLDPLSFLRFARQSSAIVSPFRASRGPLSLLRFARPGSSFVLLLRASQIHFRFSVSLVTVQRSFLRFARRRSAFASPYRT